MTGRTVLIVVHDYPPIRSAGTERVLKFSQYLPEFGYRPIVLTTGRYGGLADDAAHDVHRADDLVHVLFSPLRRRRAAGVAAEEQVRIATVPGGSVLGRVRDRAMIPDTKIGWLIPALQVGGRLIADRRPDLIFSSSPPETTHLIAGRLARASRVPWVADLRDGWARQSPNPALREGPLRQALELRLERGMMAQARAVTSTTPALSEDLAQRYPSACPIVTITNGFDSVDLAGLVRKRQDDGLFRLVYTGAFSMSSPDRSAEPFFAGLAELVQADPATRLRVQIIGTLTENEQRLRERFGLAQIVTLMPPVRRDAVYQYQVDADALLLVQGPGTPGLIPSKLFDYIAAGKPVLALTDGNVSEEIIREYALGKIAASNDPSAIAAALRDLMARQSEGATWPGFDEARRHFERRTLTASLAALFDEVLRAA